MSHDGWIWPRRSTNMGLPFETALSSSLGTKIEALAPAEWIRTIAGADSMAVMICSP